MKNILEFIEYKRTLTKISMVTCYDYTSAQILKNSNVDAILIGDSLAQVMHGFQSTLHADVDLMALHTRAVSRGLEGEKFLISDLPFLSYRKGLLEAMNSAQALMQSGAQAVKLEGVAGHESIVQHLVQSGIPVMGHLGLTPQHVHQLGGYKVQGKSDQQGAQILEEAIKLQELGAFALVLECIPAVLAQKISERLLIPTIGIGAGAQCDGQILVWQDLLGMSNKSPKFVREFTQGRKSILDGLNEFSSKVKSKEFPSEREWYHA